MNVLPFKSKSWGVLFFVLFLTVAALAASIAFCLSLSHYGEAKNSLVLLLIPCFYPFLLSRDPSRLCLLVMIFLLPVLGLAVPPRELDIDTFNVLLALLAACHFFQSLGGNERARDASFSHLRFPFLFLLAASIMSSLLSEDKAVSFWEIYRTLKFALFYWFFVKIVRTEKDLRLVAMLLIIGYAGCVILGLLQGVLHVGLNLLATMNVTNTSYAAGGVEVTRVYGPFVASLDLAHFLLVPLFLSLAFFLEAKKLDSKVLWGGLFVSGAAVLVMTLTRGAILSFVLVSGVVFLSRAKLNVLIPAIALVTVAVLGAWLLPQTFSHAVPSIIVDRFTDLDRDYRLGGRGTLWDCAWQIFLTHPLFGVGYNNLVELIPTYVPGITWISFYQDIRGLTSLETVGYGHMMVDSTYFTLLAEIGGVGLGIFLLIIAKVTATFYHVYRRARQPSLSTLAFGFGTGFIASCLNLITTYDFQEVRNGMFFWLVMAASTVLARLHAEGATAPQPEMPKIEPGEPPRISSPSGATVSP